MFSPFHLSRKFNIHRRDFRVFWILAVLCTLLWLPPILGLARGYWPLGEDAVAYFVPMRELAHQSLREGILPLWNPYTFCGMPFIATSQVAFWYPPNWLLGFLPSHWALIFDLWFHSLIMAIGGYVLARSLGLSRTASLIVAVVLSLSSPITARAYAGHMTWQAARAYFPWMLWATWQSLKNPNQIWWIRVTIFLTLCVLAGHPPMLLLGFGLCAALVVYWCIENVYQKRESVRSILPVAASPLSALLFAGLLSACALLPMRELAGLTVHGSRLSFQESAVLSGTWKTLMRLIAPEWFGGNQNLQWSQGCCAHEESAYIGVLPVIFALFAPWILWPLRKQHFRVLALWSLLPFSLLMALGANAPLYRIVWQIVPPLQMTRIPVRWLECFYLVGALLTGFIFRAVFEKISTDKEKKSSEYSQRNLRMLTSVAVAFVLFFGVTMGAVMLSEPQGDFWANAARVVVKGDAVINLRSYSESLRDVALTESLMVIIFCATALLLFQLWRRFLLATNGSERVNRVTRQRLQTAVIAFVTLDLLLHGWRSAEIVSPQEMSSIRWPETIATRYQPDQRWQTSFYWLAINGAVVNNVRLANGYDPLGSKRFFDFASAAEGRNVWQAVYQPEQRSALWNVVGVTHTVTQRSANEPLLNLRGWQREVNTQKWELWRHDAAWPLFYTTNHVVQAPENQQLRVLDTLAKKPLKGKWPLVTSANFDVPAGGTSSVSLQQKNLNEVLFQTRSSGSSVLVWSEAAFPGWRAWSGEKPVAIESANYLFQAVNIPAGQATVRFVYEPQSLRLGLFISLFAGAFWVAMIVAMPRKNKRVKDKS